MIWGGAVALLAIWAAASLTWPLGRDQGVFAWVGSVIARGGLPYRDAWDSKGPFVYYAYAAVVRLFGANTWGPRVFDLAFALAGAIALYHIGSRLAGRIAGAYGALALALRYAALGYWHTAQADGWTGLLLLLGFAPLLGRPAAADIDVLAEHRSRRLALAAALAGLVVGLAILDKPTYGLLLLVPLTYLAADRAAARRTRAAIACAAAAAAIVAATMVAFAGAGALDDLYDAVVAFNLSTYTALDQNGPFGHLTHILTFFSKGTIAILLPAAVLGFWHLGRARPAAALALGAWLLAALGVVISQGKYYDYHWIPIYPPLALLAGIGIADLWEVARAPSPRGMLLAVSTALVVLWLPAYAILHDVLAWRRMAMGRTTRAEYLTRFPQYDDPGFEAGSERMLAYLRAHTRPGETLLVWGTQPVLNFLAGLPAPTRFGHNLPLVAEPDTPLRRRYRATFLAELSAAPPRYILVVRGDANRLVGATSSEYVDSLPRFRGFLNRRYRLETVIGRYEVYRLRE